MKTGLSAIVVCLLLNHLGATAHDAQAEPDKTKPLDISSVPHTACDSLYHGSH